MSKQDKSFRITTVAALAASIAISLPVTSLAQEQKLRIEEIIVTAQKREQSLQDVPVAVTALDAAALEASRIENILDLQFNAPNVMFNANRNYTIRGVGTQVYGGSRDAGIGFLVNGVFIQAPEETTEMYDLERVEVLRGPQGTLFGRNTTGGAMNFITKRAESDFSASAELQVEENNGYRFNGVINFPLSDSVWQRFSVNTVNRDGYTKNLFTGNDVDGRDQQAIRSSTHFEFNDETSADLVLDYYTEDSTRNFSPKSLCLPDPTFVCSPDARAADFPDVNFAIDFFFLTGAVRADKWLENPSDLRTVNMDTEPKHDGNQFIATFELNHEFGDHTFTSVTGYQERERKTLRDFDLGAAPFGFIPGDYTNLLGTDFTIADDGNGNGVWTYLEGGDSNIVTTTAYRSSQISAQDVDQWSQEFRLASNFEGNLNYLLGAYYLDANYIGLVSTYAPAGFTNGGVLGDTRPATTESLAFFGELYWDVSDTVEIIAGLRNSDEDKTIRTGNGTWVTEIANYFEGSTSFSETTGRFVVNWSPELSSGADSMFYASYSRGYKAGGFNPGNAVQPTFAPEEVDSFEIGTKNLLLDSRLQLNAAVFDYSYDNLTLGQIVGTLALNANVPKSTVSGAEVEVVAVPNESWRLEAAVGFLSTEIDSDFITADASRGGADFNLRGNDLPNSPDMTVKLATQYNAEFGNGWWVTPRVDYYWQDEFFTRSFNTGADKVDSWSVLDLAVSFGKTDAPWDITLFVKNIEDEDSITQVETNSELVGSFKSIFLLDPRTIAVAFRYRWD